MIIGRVVVDKGNEEENAQEPTPKGNPRFFARRHVAQPLAFA